MGYVMRNIAAVLFFVSVCFAVERQPQPTNREIFFRLCDSAVTEIASNGLMQFQSVALQTGRDVISSFFHQRFIQGLVLKNIPVFVKTDSTMTTLELTVRESSVFYGEVFNESFFGERRTERKIKLSILATLISNNDGKVITVIQVSRMFVDTVAYSTIDQLNDSAPPMSGYVKPELSFFDSIIEPAIVTVASGVAIYLFFTIRS